MQDDAWAEYARIQQLARSKHLSDQSWGAEGALDTILDHIERGEAVTRQQADNLVTNRARKERVRRKLLARHGHLLDDEPANDNDRHAAAFELARHQARSREREWQLMLCVGAGFTYVEIANAEGVPEPTVKTWVRRARLKLQRERSRLR